MIFDEWIFKNITFFNFGSTQKNSDFSEIDPPKKILNRKISQISNAFDFRKNKFLHGTFPCNLFILKLAIFLQPLEILYNIMCTI